MKESLQNLKEILMIIFAKKVYMRWVDNYYCNPLDITEHFYELMEKHSLAEHFLFEEYINYSAKSIDLLINIAENLSNESKNIIDEIQNRHFVKRYVNKEMLGNDTLSLRRRELLL